MLPEAALPDAALAVCATGAGAPFRSRQGTHEEGLDPTPTSREVVVAWRQCPNGVHIIGKDDPGIDGERTAAPNTPNRFAQKIDSVGEQSVAPPLQ
jgi:hypothetical protein